MKISMYEVNFGEAIIYQEGIEKILVDCGAKFRPRGGMAYDRIRNEIDENTSLMITHFDEDHYNGICEIPDGFRFKEILLPLYLYDEKELSDTMEVFEDTLYVWTYLIAVRKKKKISSLHKFFLKLPKLVHSIDNIKCVGEGDVFYIGGSRFDVLWPQKECSIKNKRYKDEVELILRELAQDEDGMDLFINKADQYVKSFVKLYQILASNGRENQYSENNSIEFFYNELASLNQEYEDLINMQMNIKIDQKSKRKMEAVNSVKIRSMNECSIVFESGEDVIAFGDVSPRIINYLKKSKKITEKDYRVVKVQHHGTKSYWSDNLPNAEKYLVSNSGEANVNWLIDKRYGEKYPKQMVCTNNYGDRCEFWNSGRTCLNCKAISSCQKIMLDTCSMGILFK